MRRSGWLAMLVLVLILPSSAAAQQSAAADSGWPKGYVAEFGTMWTFDAPPLEYWKARYGFTPDSGWLDHVRLAAVRLPGCSASFVSADGLVATNHHCSRSCIAAVSPTDTNYMTTGFVAAGRSDEKKCPGLYVDQLRSIRDVTQQIRSAVTARSSAAQVKQRQAAIDQLEKGCADRPELHCQVVAFYNGGMYSLYTYQRYSDLRLVMAPEETISFFGGDPDNFTYPRYDLDVSLLRVYQNDQPFHPENYLRWSTTGAREGELLFTVGNPGSTGRLLTVAQMEYLRDVQYPFQLAGLARNIAAAKQYAATGDAAEREMENQIFSLQNAQKAIRGYRSGLLDSTIMARKRAFERDFRSRIKANPRLQARYGGAWDSIATAERKLRAIATEANFYGFSGSTLLNFAGALVRLPQQAALPDSQRLPQYQGEGLARIRSALAGPLQVNPRFDELTLAAQLRAAQEALPKGDPFLQAVLQGRTPAEAAHQLVAGSKVGDQSFRRQLLEGGAAAVAASDDPMIQAARRIAPISRRVADQVGRLEDVISANAEKIGQAIYAAYGKALPPDATFTLRISDGVAKGFPYNGTIAPWRTSFYGLYGRSADFGGQPPFQLPERWKARRDSLDLSQPLDFVSTNDIIGGNSGSPVINRNAEVVGLIFDGNIEMLPNRFIFTEEVARAVSVDARAISEALRTVYDAGWIADELAGK